MYEFITGPLLWVVFAAFLGGLAYRVVWYVKGLSWQLDRVAYSAFPADGAKGAIRSIFFWLVPFGTRSWRIKPGFTAIFFGFHIGAVLVPLFLTGHAVLLHERFGVSWPSIPQGLADWLTAIAIVSLVCIAVRRISLPEVRIVTSWYDWLLIVLAGLPFVTGFVAVMHWGDYQFWIIAHILTGELLLVSIPFTKLYHVVGFFLTRAQLGMDFGIKRGGRKGRNMPW